MLSDEEIKKAKFLMLEIEIENKDLQEEKIVEDIRNILSRIQKSKKDKIKIDFAQRIQQAEKQGKIDEVKKLLKELHHVIKKN